MINKASRHTFKKLKTTDMHITYYTTALKSTTSAESLLVAEASVITTNGMKLMNQTCKRQQTNQATNITQKIARSPPQKLIKIK